MIAKYIRELLFDHSCVMVPGFGGFLTEEKSAQINPISNLFQAPSVNLAFNASLTKDDGLLKSEISIAEGITIDAAFEEIKRFVGNIENELSLKKEAFIEGLGVFIKQNGIISYKPESISNPNIEGYGLTEFKFEPIERNVEDMKQARPVPPARRVVKRTPKANVEKVTKKVVKEKKEDENVPNRKAIFLLLPILLLVLGGGIAGYTLFSKGESQDVQLAENSDDLHSTDQASVLGSHSEESHSEESLDHDVESSHDLNEESTDDDIDYSGDTHMDEVESVEHVAEVHVEESHAVETISKSGSFHVIGGVFSSMDNAQKFSSKHEGTSILEIDGQFKVSVGSYPTLNKAANSLNNLQSQYGSDVWIVKY